MSDTSAKTLTAIVNEPCPACRALRLVSRTGFAVCDRCGAWRDASGEHRNSEAGTTDCADGAARKGTSDEKQNGNQ